MRTTALALSFVLLLGVGCNKASEKDVDTLIAGLEELWTGYLKALTDNKADPAKALAEGQKFIDANKAKIEKVAKVFSMKGTQAQIDKVKKAYDTQIEKAGTALGELSEAWGDNADALQKLRDQVEKFESDMKTAPP